MLEALTSRPSSQPNPKHLACLSPMQGMYFHRNTAFTYGAGIAAGDGTAINITDSLFEGNGRSDCAFTKPPVVSGAELRKCVMPG